MRAQEMDRDSSVRNRGEERLTVPDAIDNTPAPMQVVSDDDAPRYTSSYPVYATKGKSISEPSPGIRQYFEQPGGVSIQQRKRETAVENTAPAYAHATIVRQLEERPREQSGAMREKREIAQAYAALKQEYEAQRNENKALRQDNESVRAMLDQRTSELYGVERFFTTADKFSGSEVVTTLRKLNEGVQQSSTFIAEWVARNLKFKAPRVYQTSTRVDEQTRASGLLGMQLIRALKTRKQVDNPILVEIAIQAYLMCELCTVTSQRSTQGSHNAFIDGIYQRMREAEGQAISGNWRALTHRYAASARTEDPEFMRMETTIVSGLSDVLLAAGCTNSMYDIASALRSKFADKIRDFVSLARDINMIIGAGVISDDLEILWMRPETSFDGRMMQDWDDDGKGQGTLSEMERPQETVLCTMELGLMKRARASAAGKRSEDSKSIMVKPRVALRSILDVIGHP